MRELLRSSLIALTVLSCTVAEADTTADLAHEVRSILSDACFHCHGPDDESREADLRLDNATDVLSVIVPGSAEDSELFARVSADDTDLVMPPKDSGKALDAEQIALLREWIEQGATFQKHWAFVAPKSPDIPSAQSDGWS